MHLILNLNNKFIDYYIYCYIYVIYKTNSLVIVGVYA